MSTIPSTTSRRSVHRSSRPKKSPYSEFSPVKLVFPRLWYSSGSLSQAGFLASSSPAGTTGVYGNEVASTSGNV